MMHHLKKTIMVKKNVQAYKFSSYSQKSGWDIFIYSKRITVEFFISAISFSPLEWYKPRYASLIPCVSGF